jgi:hypothetical protein
MLDETAEIAGSQEESNKKRIAYKPIEQASYS